MTSLLYQTMDPAICQQLHYLRHEVLSARFKGRVVIEFADGEPIENVHDARQVADRMLALVNLPRLGPHWQFADRTRAATIITSVLHWNLETFNAMVPQDQAEQLTEKLLNHFTTPTFHLTNVRPTADLTRSPHRWASGSEQAELDAGVAIITPGLVGLIWIEDRP